MLALVTGGTAGIGLEFARQLAARGWDLVLVARDGPRLERTAAELGAAHGVATRTIVADLARDDDVDRLVAELRSMPALDLLVNNAGFGTRGTLAEADPATQAAMVRVHVLAPMRLVQAALPRMLERDRGAVINVASVAAFVSSPRNVNYCATKAYLVSFTRGLAAELRATGVRAQALCPGFTHTEFHDRMQSDKGAIPAFAWMHVRDVVAASLAALDAGGPVVVVPGLGYRLAAAALRIIPPGLVSALAGRTRY